jgi:hypothetical protein
VDKKHFIKNEMGSPIKGPVKRKNTSPSKKIHLFSLVLLLSRQHSLALLSPFFAPVISFLSVLGQHAWGKGGRVSISGTSYNDAVKKKMTKF